MPYITQDKRDKLDPVVEQLHQILTDLHDNDISDNMEGNINYTITRLLMMVYGDRDSTRYAQVNNALGVLDAVSKEYYRKVAAPYEDQKEFENGPVVRFRNVAE